MTKRAFKDITWTKTTISASLLFLTVFAGLALSKEMGVYVTEGINLAVMSVIPSSLPFMIISDFYTCYGHPERLPLLGSLFSRLFGLPKSALGAFICGNVGGFPIGSNMSAELYRSGEISTYDCERLLALSANPSAAFVIGGVGLGMFGDGRMGAILLFAIYASCFLCGIITRANTDNIHLCTVKTRQNYSFVSSVKKAGTSTVAIISFISCFSVLAGLVKKHIKNPYISSLTIMLLEVTNAANFFSSTELFPDILCLFLTGFSLGFGGISVMMQSSVFIEDLPVSMKKYFFIKLLQGLIAGAISSVIFYFF